MTMLIERPTRAPDASFDPIADAIADVEGATAVQDEAPVKTKELVIVNWSGELDRIWPTLILASTAAASGVKCKVFVTFWGLLPFVKDSVRITGENWMQRMLSFMQRPGID